MAPDPESPPSSPSPGTAPSAAARRLAVAIALSPVLSPRDRAALFLEHGAQGAVEAFRRRFGEPDRGLLDAASAWIRRAADREHRLLLLGAPGYPALLAESAAPPVALEVAGAADLDRPSVALVGARRGTPYGLEIADALARGLAAAGLTVVSGLARGVDGVAHRAALDAAGTTVAVLGAGLARIYPPEHRALASACAGSGAVVSEFPPQTRPLPHHFPRRNRIIAGLTLGVVVVEAARRSGSLSTARHAVDNGREVCAVPGPVGSETSEGCHSLIRSGAALVTSVDEVLEQLGFERREPRLPPAPGQRPKPGPEAAAGGEAPEGDAAVVLRTLRASPSGLDMDSAIAMCGLPIPDALAALSELERSGLVRRYPGDFLKAAR